jgi:hypothetical protein
VAVTAFCAPVVVQNLNAFGSWIPDLAQSDLLQGPSGNAGFLFDLLEFVAPWLKPGNHALMR